MKVALVIHDHDTASLFLDVNNAPKGALAFELVLSGVPFEEIQDDEIYVWLMSDNKLEVVERESFDFETVSQERHTIPTPILCLDKDDPYFADAD